MCCKMKKEATIFVYPLATFISVTAYEVYATFLPSYPISWAIFGFQLLFIFTVRILYPYLEGTTLGLLQISEEVGKVSIKETFKRQPKAIIYSMMRIEVSWAIAQLF